MDPKFKKYETKLFEDLVEKHKSQVGVEKPSFLSPEFTTPKLKTGNVAVITLWDMAPTEISKKLLHSCDIHTVIDDSMEIYYGYRKKLKSR